MTIKDFLCFCLNPNNLESFTFLSYKGYFLNSYSLQLGKKGPAGQAVFLSNGVSIV